MALVRFSPSFDPVSSLLTLQRELERAFENPGMGFNLGISGRGVYPPINVFGDADGAVIRIEVPGLAAEQLSIESQGRTLTVAGQREQTPSSDAAFHRRERRSGAFSRSIQLPEDLDLSRAQASCEHGILTVRVPKREEAKPRQITVRAA